MMMAHGYPLDQVLIFSTKRIKSRRSQLLRGRICRIGGCVRADGGADGVLHARLCQVNGSNELLRDAGAGIQR